MILPVSIQMRILWMLAMVTVFVVLVQYQTSGTWSQQQGQPLVRPDTVAEDLVSMALSKVVIDEDVHVSRDLLTGITRQIARYVVYSASCVPSASGTADGAPNTIYVITPTYRRPEQIADLTRLAQTLMLVRDIHWLVVEDSHAKSPQLTALLQSFGIRYEHLIGEHVSFLYANRFFFTFTFFRAGNNGIHSTKKRKRKERRRPCHRRYIGFSDSDANRNNLLNPQTFLSQIF